MSDIPTIMLLLAIVLCLAAISMRLGCIAEALERISTRLEDK